MGKVTEFLNWLSGEDGGGGGKSSFSSRRPSKSAKNAQARNRQMLFKLKLQIKRMQKQQRKLEFQADKSRQKAIQSKRDGDEQRARMYAGEMLKYRKLAANMINFVTGLEGMKFKLEQITETQKMADMFTAIDSSLQNMKASISVPELQESLDSINQTIAEMDANLEITQDGIEISTDANIPEKEVDGALDEIDAELAAEAGLPAAEIGQEENEKIKTWKERLDSLKD
ncbi:MAG: Snf7 family protein [Promethearchaeota archaeon]